MKPHLPPSCLTALDALALGEDRAEARAHRQGCPDCAARVAKLALLREGFSADDALSDLARARLGARLLTAVDEERPRVSAHLSRSLALAAAAALVLLLGLCLRTSTSSPRAAVILAGQPAGSSPLVGVAVEPASWPGAALLVGRELVRIELPAGVVLRARLGDQAVLGLEGPAELAVEHADGADVTLGLARGRILGSYDGARGGRLTIRAPGAVASVIGTLFLVDARRPAVRVAVAHGRVRVQGRSETALVEGREAWSEPRGLTALDGREQRELERFEASLAPEEEEARASREGEAAGRAEARHQSAAGPRADRSRQPRSPAAAASRRPAPAPAPAVRPPPPQPPTPASLYQHAEQAMRRGDQPRARLLLVEVVAAGGALAAQARYELAHLALRAGDAREAAAQLGRLLAAGAEPRLIEPASYLRCRVALQSRDAGAARCLREYRARFPGSPHDEAALGTLLALEAGDCARLRPLAEEYLRRTPRGERAAAVRARLAACR